MPCKICIIGAGSAIFSLNLIKDICVNKHFENCTVSLMDVNEARLDAIYNLCIRYAQELGEKLNVVKTTDRREAMRDADFVLNVALDYGHDRYKVGIKVAYANGYRFGGSLHVLHDEAFYINFYQLRLMESILQDVLAICPNAWYIMVANPVQGGVTYLQRKYKNAKIIGMCHGYTGVYTLTDAMGMDRKDVSYEISGVNHFIWLTSFRYQGKNAYPLLDQWLKMHHGKIVENAEEIEKIGLKADEISPKAIDLYKRYGLFPIGDTASSGGGAWGWEYHVDTQTETQYGSQPYKWYEKYFAEGEQNVQKIRRVTEDHSVKVSEVFSTMPSDEPMIPLIEGLAFDTANKVVVNILNDGGYMKGLPTDYEVEIAAIVDKHGVHPIHNNGLPKPIMAHLLRDRIASVEMELAAFENHSRELLVDLVLMDPWTKTRRQAERLIHDIMALPCNKEMNMYYK